MDVNELFTNLRTGLLTVCPDYQVIRALNNKVPPPKVNYILMQPVIFNRISTNEIENSDTEQTETNDTIFTVQLDFYGDESYEAALKVFTLFRGEYFMQYGITPLFSSDIRQLSYIEPARLMLQRYNLDLYFYYEPSATFAMQTANQATFNTFTLAN